MKSAIYLDEGNTQLVLTPENEWEKNILKMIHQTIPDKTYMGGFYECRGGWYRQNTEYSTDESLIIRLQKQAPIPQSPLNHMPSCS